ncbi:hypothetical protein PMIN01_04619 [Paraphaeosphaeria minitans]|uniref:Uncharacterized protein n=1 Tax=Paraphaeosphaeria minitans TaxID=565426 RepID=A0A9P6KS41_9PLEO|nr:hypothetical protein PMIN01_04619 [Paraphaeosphaeria minitans]
MVHIWILRFDRLLGRKRTLLVPQCEKLWLAFWSEMPSVLRFCGVRLGLRLRWCPCLRLSFTQELQVPNRLLLHGCGAHL